MKLQIFNGGLNTRLAPHLIGVTEGIIFSNINIEEAVLKPVKKNAATGIELGKYAHYFIAKNEWISSVINRDYVEYQEKVYFSEDNSIPQVYDGVNTFNLGIANPSNVLTLTPAAGVLNGVYTYVYTYYNSSTGIESGTSFLAEVTLTNQEVAITNLTTSTDPQVTHKRIYRVGGDLTAFSLIATISNITTNYTDNIADINIDGKLLESEAYLQAKNGAKFLTEVYAMMFYALGDKLYYTPIGKPWAWPEEFFIDFPLSITGIGILNTGLVVFSGLKAYIITGNTPSTLSKYPLSDTQGCKSHKTIARLEDTLFWLSNDGICASTGGAPKVISRPKLGKLTIDPIVAVTLDDVYYLQHTTGSIALDIRFGQSYKNLNLGNTYLTVGNDKVYGYFTNKYHELFVNEESETFSYLSPVFLDGSYTERKSYNSFYIRSEGQITISIYITGVKVNTWKLTTTDTHDLDIKQEYKNGYSVQFEISGTGAVFEIKYSPYGDEKP